MDIFIFYLLFISSHTDSEEKIEYFQDHSDITLITLCFSWVFDQNLGIAIQPLWMTEIWFLYLKYTFSVFDASLSMLVI